MLLVVLSGFLVAALASVICRLLPRAGGALLALLPAGLFVYFLGLLPPVNAGESLRYAYAWIPGLSINLTFLVDGLSLLFALLITGIGTFILLFAGRYLQGHRDLGRLYTLLLSFMAAMLGLVLSDNLINLFVF